jgi:hypothetical protein
MAGNAQLRIRKVPEKPTTIGNLAQAYYSFKGQCHEIFDFWFFS